ncbi:MAG: hypothetical protein JNK64_30770 [Myxococcales bacterium]|nr:hypothetical protein [Myxococcales bacterium]
MRTRLLAAIAIMAGCGGGAPATAPTTPPPATAPAPAASAAGPADGTTAEAAAGPWGASVPAPETEARVAAMLGRLRDGALAPGDLGTVVAFGAGLWSTWQLGGMGSDAGIPVMARVAVGDHAVIAHGRAVRGAALAPFMASAAMRGTARYFADGEVGPASAAERQLYYAGIAWEIAGEPLTVVRKPGETLVVVLDEQGQLFQLDTLGPWYRLVTGETSEITQYQPTAATQP